MAGVTVPAYKQFWTNKRTSLNNEEKDLISKYPDATASIKQLFKVLCDVGDLASHTSLLLRQSEVWAAITGSTVENRKLLQSSQR
jgi:hypothetical protein